MVYIDAFSHAKVSQSKNRNVVMDFISNNVILTDFSKKARAENGEKKSNE